MAHSSQRFLRDLDKKLWTAADRLLANLDAAVYKHAVLGLIFLKYVSGSFIARQRETSSGFLRFPGGRHCRDSAKLPPGTEFESLAGTPRVQTGKAEGMARRQITNGNNPAKGSPATAGYKITSTGALEAVERQDPSQAERDRLVCWQARRVRAAASINRRGVLNKTYTHLQLDPAIWAASSTLNMRRPFGATFVPT